MMPTIEETTKLVQEINAKMVELTEMKKKIIQEAEAEKLPPEIFVPQLDMIDTYSTELSEYLNMFAYIDSEDHFEEIDLPIVPEVA